MDMTLLAQLGIIAALIPTVAAIVKPTVDNLRSALEFESKFCVPLNYVLCILLMSLMVLAFSTSWPASIGEVLVLIAKTLVGGWIAGNFAGAITDTHNRVRK